ncbi:ATP-binding cassette domain-containing protein [Chelativorans sp. ZYF759]|uniref:ABC transporter ATP-binding protein n=1 Tax=Chelativorans sp. ZYF759 TaxID=2692213 RepID=UPI00145DCC63|nr:ATP-binding cassette domain-containing protein [Chelativorans sp. ZYF759]NMG41575.1 ATP-binding cassette domain-containing protein [Chelativorans sp. ZYF759]
MPEGKAAAAWQDTSIKYPYQDKAAAGPLSLALEAGERLLLLGPSGCGKSTLLNTLTGLIPGTIPAEVTGEVQLFGEKVKSRPPAEWSRQVAQLFQDADQTLCGMTVADEVAFALENLGLPEGEILQRTAAAIDRVGLEPAFGVRRTMRLSGGEKQLVAMAAALAQGAPLFVADEPTAHLAPRAAERLRALLLEPGRSTSVLIIDHRLDGLIDRVDRVAVMGPDGTLVAQGPPAALFREHGELLARFGIWQPLASLLDAELASANLAASDPPLHLSDVLTHIDRLPPDARRLATGIARAFVGRRVRPAIDAGATLSALKGADCAPLFGPVVLRDVSVELRAGEVLGILGGNGAGKSTLGASLAGLLRLKGGRRSGPPGGMAFQNPENQFVTGSLREEIESATDAILTAPEREQRVATMLRRWRLEGLENSHPYELSQGQKRRLALATLTASGRWPFLVLDEPTAGLDAAGAAAVAAQVANLADIGHGVAVITHDMDFALAVCHRVVLVGEGGLIGEGRPGELMRDHALMARAGLEPPTILPALEWLERVPTC